MTKLFKINENTAYIFFMSIISGCPSNAKIAKEMYDEHLININDIQKIILFSHFSSPLFIISMIKFHPYLVIFAHYIGNIFIGLIIRNRYLSQKNNVNYQRQQIGFGKMLTKSINSAMTTLLFILGTIVTFYIITSIINLPIAKLTMELAQGLNYLETLSLDIKTQTILKGALLSFGGVCIHFQVYGILSELKIKYFPYFLSRICHAIITAIILFILIPK